jgi:hypothetical protein
MKTPGLALNGIPYNLVGTSEQWLAMSPVAENASKKESKK